MPVSHSLVLDSERCELVKAADLGMKKKIRVSEEKVMVALKIHCEAERKRRQRINAHLATLRGLVPCTAKMDKAALLGEVIDQIKRLKKMATESRKDHLIIPTDSDEVRIEPHREADGTISLKASLCCEYRPKILSELREAMHDLSLIILRAEVSTLGSRVKNIFVCTGKEEDMNRGNLEEHKFYMNSVLQVFGRVLDRVSTSDNYTPRLTFPNNKRRTSIFHHIDEGA